LIALFVDMSYFYMQFGDSAMKAGKHERAVVWYGRAVRADASNAEYYYARGSAHQAHCDTDAALADFTEATRLDAQAAYAWTARCIVEYQRRDLDGAVASATIALLLSPDDADALLMRALAYHWLNRLDESLADFDYLVRLRPATGDVHWWRGDVHSDAGRYDDALDDFRQAEIYGCGDDMAISRCITFFRVGRNEAALAHIAAFVAAHPEDAAALAVKAFMLATCPDDALRDGGRALELCQRAKAMGAAITWELDASFAAAYAELGRFDEAIRHAEEALARALPYRQEVYQARLETYRSRHPWRQAARLAPT
jgi:tetratricopeptide (TPR) repeat protein